MLNLLIPAVTSIIDKLIPDKEAAAKAKIELIRLSQDGELKELEASMSIITAEASSEHWLVAAWRPLIMLLFGVIVANNYLVYPYLSLFWTDAPVLKLPPDLWQLMKIGLGGYVVGRSVEKVAMSIKND